jgi:hypothetical protein
MGGMVIRIERVPKVQHNVPPSHGSEFQDFYVDLCIYNDGPIHDLLDTFHSLGADLLVAGAR